MQEGLPLYNGALPVAAQQKLVGVPQLPQGQLMGAAFDAAVDDGLRIVDTYTRLHDFAEEQRVEHQLRLNDRKMQEELFRAQNARWGSKGSFFNADGSVNEDNVAAFCSRWRDANDGIERTFLRRDNAIRDAGRMSRQNDDLTTRVELWTMKQALANGRKAFEANYGEAMASGDHAGAARAVAGAVASGHISEAEGRLRLTRARQGAARKNVAGKPAEQVVDATLASLGKTPTETPTETPAADATPAATETPAETETGATGDVTTRPLHGEGTGETFNGQLTLDRDMVETVAGAGVENLTVGERTRLLLDNVARMCTPNIDTATGRSAINPMAPAGAQVAVQGANAGGGWTRETYDQAVYSLGLHIVRSNSYKNMSDADMAKLIRSAVTVDGMAEQVFGDDPYPQAAYDSYLTGKVESLMSLRDGKLQQRVVAAFDEIEIPEQEVEMEFVMMRASEALKKYRMENGSSNWYAEQDVISDAIAEARDEFARNNMAESVESWRMARENLEKAEVKAIEEKMNIERAKISAAQAEAKREAEAKKKKPAKKKKKTRAELLAERPYLGEVDFVFGYKDNGCKYPSMTVPKDEYMEMLRQLECKDGEPLYCMVGKTEMLILPGEGEECSVNRQALVRMVDGLSEKNAAAVIRSVHNGVSSAVKVRKGRKQVGKRNNNKKK
ncbi:MAG: hypothetical protein IJN29_01035 [Akkermansia sp.]|nr:hypothetical protein [Akkermansia sp.]